MTTRLRQLQVDAFTDTVFRGNPAAIVVLDEWLGDETLQAITAENRYSETAFIVPSDEDAADYHLRWFTPGGEVALCGHATLGTAHALFEHLDHVGDLVRFTTKSGILSVRRAGGDLIMDFPAQPSDVIDPEPIIAELIGATPIELRCSTIDHLRRMAVFESQDIIDAAAPDVRRILDIPGGCLLITAPGEDVDFVSRFFAPYAGIDEDPVTGSAHCLMTPYWASRLGRTTLTAHQRSERGGRMTCELAGDRVLLKGRAVTFLDGWIFI